MNVNLMLFSSILVFILSSCHLRSKSLAKEAEDRVLAKQLAEALHEYHKDHNIYPMIGKLSKDTELEITKDVISTLVADKGMHNLSSKVYIDYSGRRKGKRDLLDQWGNTFTVIIDGDGDGYVSYRSSKYSSKLVYSKGKDGVVSTDDVTNQP